jgi:hypothetical protein
MTAALLSTKCKLSDESMGINSVLTAHRSITLQVVLQEVKASEGILPPTELLAWLRLFSTLVSPTRLSLGRLLTRAGDADVQDSDDAE